MVRENYIARLFSSLWHLGQGMYITMLNFVRPKVTEQYPENRGKHEYFERFRALLTMPHDENNRHRCTACGICQMNCPNGTIQVLSRTEEADGKPKKVLDRYLYDVGSCTFCALCTRSCPQNAIEFSNRFEHSVFDKSKLMKQLNKPGSRLAEKQAREDPARENPTQDKPTPEEKLDPETPMSETPMSEKTTSDKQSNTGQ